MHRIVYFTLICLTIWAPCAVVQDVATDDREAVVLKRYVELLERQPKLGTAFDRVYRHHVERGSIDEFLQPYRQRLATDGAAALLVGLVEAQRGRENQAASAFLIAEKLRATDALPSLSLARVLAAEHQFAEAVAACERAIAKQPARSELLEIYPLLAQLRLRAGFPAESLKTWQQLETLFPTDPRVQERVARGVLEAGDAAGAKQRFELLAQRATDPTARVQFAVKAAELQIQAGNRDAAIASLDRLLEGLKPESWPDRLVRQRIDEAFTQRDDIAGLDAYFRTRLKRHPDDIDSQVRLAKLLAGQRQMDEAVIVLRGALKVAPSQRVARQTLIELLIAQRKFAEAQTEYTELDRQSPNDADTLRAWGQLVLRDESRPLPERQVQAAAIWRRMVAAKPQDAAVQVQVAEWLRSIQRTDEAVTLYQSAVELAPNETQYREALGELLFRLNRRSEAVTAWREIATGPRKTAEHLCRLGQLLKNHDERDAALAAYAEANRLEPRFADLLSHARLLTEAKQFEAALQLVAQAESLAESDDQQRQVVVAELETLQAADRIGPELQRLRERTTKPDASVADCLRLARLSLLTDRVDDALLAARLAVGKDGDSIAARSLLAQITQSARQWPEAVESLKWLIEHDRRSESKHLAALLEIDRERQDFTAALAIAQRLIAAAPDQPDYRRTQAELLFALNRPDEGLAALREAARRSGESTAWEDLAAKLVILKRREEAIETYWHAFSLAKTDDARLTMARKLAKLTHQTPQFVRVVQRLERLRFEGQQDRAMRQCLVEVHRTVGESAAAMAQLESLRADFPSDVQVLRELVALHQIAGTLQSAAAYQTQLVSLEPTTANESLLAKLLHDSGNLTAYDSIMRRVAARPMSPAERLHFIDDLVQANRRPFAIELLEQQVAAEPDDWESLFRLANVLRQSGYGESAARHLARLRELKLTASQQVSVLTPTNTPSLETAPPLSLRDELVQRLQQARVAMSFLVSSTAPVRGQVAPTTSRGPTDFKAARAAALYGLLVLDPKSDQTRQVRQRFWKSLEQVEGPPDADLWDWFAVLRSGPFAGLDSPADDLGSASRSRQDEHLQAIARQLAREEGPLGKLLLLSWLGGASGLSRDFPVSSNNPSAGKFAAPPDANRQSFFSIQPDAATLDALVVAFDSLRVSHPQSLQLKSDVVQLIVELRVAGKETAAQRIVESSVPLARTIDELSNLLVATADTPGFDLVLDRIRDRLLGPDGAAPRELAASEVVPPAQIGAILRVLNQQPLKSGQSKVALHQVVEWSLRHLARAKSAPNYPTWLTKLPEKTDAPLPVRSPPTPFVTPRPALGGGPGLAPRALYDNPYGIRATVTFDEPLLVMFYAQFFSTSVNRQVVPALLSALMEAERTSPPREKLFIQLFRATALAWLFQDNESLRVLEEVVAAYPQDFAARVQFVDLLWSTSQFAAALARLDEATLPDSATDLKNHRERYALQLAVMLRDKNRATRAVQHLADAQLSSADWYEVLRLAVTTDPTGAGKQFLATATPPRSEIGPDMFDLASAHFICGQPEQAVASTLLVLKNLPPSNPQLVPLFRYSPAYWERQRNLAVLLESPAKTEAKVVALLETILFHNRWIERTRYSDQLREVLAKLETDSPTLLTQKAVNSFQAMRFDESCDLFLRACRGRIETLDEQLDVIDQAFLQAKRPAEFVQLLTDSDLRTLPKASERAVQIARQRIISGQGAVGALKLLRSGSVALPSYQQAALRQLKDEDASQHWPFFLVRHEDLFPITPQGKIKPWLGLDERTSDGTSRNNNAFEDIIPAITESGLRAALKTQAQQSREQVPIWLAGEFYLAYFDLQDSQFADAQVRLTKLADVPIPIDVQSRMARIISRVPNAESIAISFLEQLSVRGPAQLQPLDALPAWHLAWMHSKRGEPHHIERVLDRAVRHQEFLIDQLPEENRLTRRYQVWLSQIGVLHEFGCGGAELRQLRQVHQHATRIAPSERPKVWDLSHPQFFQLDRVRTALATASFEDASRFLADFVQLAEANQPESTSRVELLLDVTSPGLASSSFTSFFELCVEAASKLDDTKRLDALRERLAVAAQHRPDLTVAIAQARLAFASKDDAARDKTLETLDAARRAAPLPAESKSSAAQQQLQDQIALWMIARKIRPTDSPQRSAWRSALETAASAAAQRHPREAWREALQAEQRRGL